MTAPTMDALCYCEDVECVRTHPAATCGDCGAHLFLDDVNTHACPPPAPRPAVNPHYLAYAAAHGFAGDPDGMLAHDRATFLGGTMLRFLQWISERRRAFLLEQGLHPDARLDDQQLAAFTAWLTATTAEGTR